MSRSLVGIPGARTGLLRSATSPQGRLTVTDLLSAALAEIRERQREFARWHANIDAKASAADVPRLLTAFEILLKAHARYTTTELHAELLTALRGEGNHG